MRPRTRPGSRLNRVDSRSAVPVQRRYEYRAFTGRAGGRPIQLDMQIGGPNNSLDETVQTLCEGAVDLRCRVRGASSCIRVLWGGGVVDKA